jgi:phage shock protein C
MTLADELGKLTELRDRGALTESEFHHAKSQLLQSQPFPYAKVLTPEPPPRADLRTLARNLGRSLQDRVLGGVCGGLAHETRLPSWLWRAVFTLGLIAYGTSALIYIVLWAFMPIEPDEESEQPA